MHIAAQGSNTGQQGLLPVAAPLSLSLLALLSCFLLILLLFINAYL
jgi:hypothetical protein